MVLGGVVFLSGLMSLGTMGPESFNPRQIEVTIARIGFLDDRAVVKLGLKHLGQILEKQDLSTNENLKEALLKVMSANPETYPALGNDTRLSAGRFLGQARLVNAAEKDLLVLLSEKNADPPKAALVEFAKTTKTNPSAQLVEELKKLHFTSTLVDMALASADKDLITYLVQLAQHEVNYDILYGLNAREAADEVAMHLRHQLEVPKAPTDVEAMLTTYHSIQLSWKDNSLSEVSFVIFRGQGDEELKEISRVPANQNYFSDPDIVGGTTYRYRVRSFNWNRDTSDSVETRIEVPAFPDPLPDPAPPIPALPSFPMPGLDIVSLTKKIRIDIEGQIHAATVEVMMDLLRKTQSPLAGALQVGKTFEAQFTKALFDADGLSTSLGLKVIEALRVRANYESTNMSESENARRQNATSLRNNANALDRLFNADLTLSPDT